MKHLPAICRKKLQIDIQRKADPVNLIKTIKKETTIGNKFQTMKGGMFM